MIKYFNTFDNICFDTWNGALYHLQRVHETPTWEGHWYITVKKIEDAMEYLLEPPSRKDIIKEFHDTKWILFGQKFQNNNIGAASTNYYGNIFENIKRVKACFSPGNVERLEFMLHKIQAPRKYKNEDYWGWINFEKDNCLEYVWTSKIQCQMCLPGMTHKKLEDEGLGLLVRLTVKSLGIIKPKKIRKKSKVKKDPVQVLTAPKLMRKIVWR